MADFIVGSVARDDDFWFRKEFVDTIWESLNKHNVLLVAPRRIGKTSVMYQLLDNPKDSRLVIHLNVEDCKTPEQFFIEIIDAINEHQPEYFRNMVVKGWEYLSGLLGRIESIEAYEIKLKLRKSGDLQNSWRNRLDELMERIYRSGRHVLFILDEIPDMLNAMRAHSDADCSDFLHWFRKTREQSLKGEVRWLVGGSVNLMAALDRHNNVNLVNDLKSEILPPFDEAEVQEFVRSMFARYGVTYDEDIVPCIIDLLGAPIPFFLQMFAEELYHCWKKKKASLSPEDARTVFNKTLLGDIARDKLQHYRSRIEIYYPEEDREAARRILNHLSQTERGATRNILLQIFRQTEELRTNARQSGALEDAFLRLMLYLQSDFYVTDNGSGHFDFASRLLKAWWRKYYGY
jgi:AAA+ ATPase superfamily predicted ATPase